MNALDRLRFTTPSGRHAIESDARDLLAIALELQASLALVATRQHAAYHEAGHAVAYHAHGRRIRSVRVFELAGEWCGFTKAGTRWRIDQDTDPAADLIEALICLAGPFAELIFSGHPALGAGVDELALARAIVGSAAGKLGTDPEALMVETVGQVLRLLATYRPAVEAIARRLMRRRKLEGQTVNAILRAESVAGNSAPIARWDPGAAPNTTDKEGAGFGRISIPIR